MGSFSPIPRQAGALLIAVPGNVVKGPLRAEQRPERQTQNIGVCGSANGGSPLTASQQQELADRINKRALAHPRPADATHRRPGCVTKAPKAAREMLGLIQPLTLDLLQRSHLFVGSKSSSPTPSR